MFKSGMTIKQIQPYGVCGATFLRFPTHSSFYFLFVTVCRDLNMVSSYLFVYLDLSQNAYKDVKLGRKELRWIGPSVNVRS